MKKRKKEKVKSRPDVQDSDRSSIGARLRTVREYLGLSQEQVAETLDVPRSAISLMESGKRGVDILELKNLAELYGYPVTHSTNASPEPTSVNDDVQHLARAAAKLTPSDLEELRLFASFLERRKESKEQS